MKLLTASSIVSTSRASASTWRTATTAGPTQAVNIRGIGLASASAAVTNGVASYVDGLFQPAIVSTNTFKQVSQTTLLASP